jgi:hypothetical protein
MAAATLLGLLHNPAVQQALMSQVLGDSGNRQILSPSGASLPRGAVNIVLVQLLTNATEGLVEKDDISDQRYLQADSGEYLVDPASPDQHAGLILHHFQSRPSASESASGESLADTKRLRWPDHWIEAEENGEAVWFY